jgi:hypothetical protein
MAIPVRWTLPTIRAMRYLVPARVKPGLETALLRAIEDGTLGHGSVAGGEHLGNMRDARLCDDGTTRWVEVALCAAPLVTPSSGKKLNLDPNPSVSETQCPRR